MHADDQLEVLMLHMTKAATVRATDQGQFTAIVAAYTTDRGGDRILPGAFTRTIEQWQTSGKQLPLHWNHQGEPEDIIGSVDPFSMKEIPDQGLQISGQVDLENSDKAREAWRAMKTGSMSLSFGYLIPDGKSSKSAYARAMLTSPYLRAVSIRSDARGSTPYALSVPYRMFSKSMKSATSFRGSTSNVSLGAECINGRGTAFKNRGCLQMRGVDLPLGRCLDSSSPASPPVRRG